jgi:CBS domain-containing membrane protein
MSSKASSAATAPHVAERKGREGTGLIVRDLMTSRVFSLRPGNNLAAAYELMTAEHVRHVPVIDGDGDLVGLVTHRDLLRSGFIEGEELPPSAQQEKLWRKKLREVMATEVETTEPEADLRDAAQTLFENKLGCLPVVEGTRLVGILTEADFVRYFIEGSS